MEQTQEAQEIQADIEAGQVMADLANRAYDSILTHRAYIEEQAEHKRLGHRGDYEAEAAHRRDILREQERFRIGLTAAEMLIGSGTKAGKVLTARNQPSAEVAA